MIKKIKWYNTKWTYLAAIVIIVVSLYFGIRESVTYFNFNEYQKTKIDSLLNEMKSTDTLIEMQERDIKELRNSLNKINTEYETNQIKKLKEELRLHKSKMIKRDTINLIKVEKNPEALVKFFNDLLQNKK